MSTLTSPPGTLRTRPARDPLLGSDRLTCAGVYRRAIAIALLGGVFTNIGGMISTFLYPTSAAPRYTNGAAFGISAGLIMFVGAAFNVWNLRRVNRKRQQRADALPSDYAHVPGPLDVRCPREAERSSFLTLRRIATSASASVSERGEPGCLPASVYRPSVVAAIASL